MPHTEEIQFMATEPRSDEKGAPKSLPRGSQKRQDTKSKDLALTPAELMRFA